MPPMKPAALPTMPITTKKEDMQTRVSETEPSNDWGSLTIGNGIPLSLAFSTSSFHLFTKSDIRTI